MPIESTKFTHSTAYLVSYSGTIPGTVYITHVGRSAHDFGEKPDPSALESGRSKNAPETLASCYEMGIPSGVYVSF